MSRRPQRGPFDLVFIDADKENKAEYVRWSLRLSRPGTVIVVDNVIRGGEVVNAENADARVQGRGSCSNCRLANRAIRPPESRPWKKGGKRGPPKLFYHLSE
ncbi:MAG TPA: hypothetical protein VKS79_21460 [Gemmataceae bacterium]|nr:hypothetical protein [Gemmataceae bacterium]